MGLVNGQLPLSELRSVPWQPREQVSRHVIDQVVAFGNAFKARFGYFPVITDSYRNREEQDRMYATLGYPKAAIPGTSNHGLGRAIDWSSGINVYGSAQWNFMNTVGRTFGMRPLNEKNKKFEPWHWQNLTSTVSDTGTAGPNIPGTPTPIHPAQPESEIYMVIFRSTAPMNRFGVLACGGGFVLLASEEEFNNVMRNGGHEVWLNPDTLDQLIADARSR